MFRTGTVAAASRLYLGTKASVVPRPDVWPEERKYVPPQDCFTLAVSDAAAPRITLELLLACLAGGSLLPTASLAYLLRTFARPGEGRV